LYVAGTASTNMDLYFACAEPAGAGQANKVIWHLQQWASDREDDLLQYMKYDMEAFVEEAIQERTAAAATAERAATIADGAAAYGRAAAPTERAAGAITECAGPSAGLVDPCLPTRTGLAAGGADAQLPAHVSARLPARARLPAGGASAHLPAHVPATGWRNKSRWHRWCARVILIAERKGLDL
jgi:hypothetical protein